MEQKNYLKINQNYMYWVSKWERACHKEPKKKISY